MDKSRYLTRGIDSREYVFLPIMTLTEKLQQTPPSFLSFLSNKLLSIYFHRAEGPNKENVGW